MSTIKVDNFQTTGGASLYPARAWCQFGTVNSTTIQADGGVSSLTDLGTGYTRFTLDNAMSAANGCAIVMSGYNSSSTILYPRQNAAIVTGTSTWEGKTGQDNSNTYENYQANALLVRT